MNNTSNQTVEERANQPLAKKPDYVYPLYFAIPAIIGLIGGFCFDSFWDGFAMAGLTLIIELILDSVWDSRLKNKNANILEAKRRIENRQKQALHEKQRQSFVCELENIKNKYGEPEKTIFLGTQKNEKYMLDRQIMVFANHKRVIIKGKDYSFDDILSCNIADDKKVTRGKISAVSKTDNGSAITRAVVGGVLAGEAGAIIGGSTAKRETAYTQENDTIEHNYTINIYTRSITNSLISIYLGANGKVANEVAALLNAIIANK